MKRNNLYTDVLTVKGYNRSLLFDSLKNDIHFLENEVFDSMAGYDFNNIPSDKIKQVFYEYLVEADLIFEVTSEIANLFPKLSLEWDTPFAISNAVIYINKKNCSSLKKMEESFFISHFNFVFDEKVDSETLNLLFDFVAGQICDSIELTFISPMEDEVKRELESLISSTKKIIGFNNYEKTGLVNLVDSDIRKFNRQTINLDRLYAQLSRNLDHFTEAQEHHTYFNRKLCIDTDGTIKNASECAEAFGNIADLTSADDLFQIISSPDFQKYWFIRKDQTDVCKDCEFRYLCTDNRVPVKRNDHEWYHTVECGYNPYISLWDDEDGYKTLSDCGVVSNQDVFSIDKEKIEAINRGLWAEETEIE